MTEPVLAPAARSYPKELMKFFFSQTEMSKEATRVGTLTLVRAVVGADGERGQGGSGGQGGGSPPGLDPFISSFVDTTGWPRSHGSQLLHVVCP